MMNRRLARAVAIALVAILAITLLAGILSATAAPVAGHQAATSRSRVLVIGDSVLEGAASQLPVALPGHQVTVDAMVNRSTLRGIDVVNQRGNNFDVVVIQLGTNDSGTPGVFAPRVERLLSTLTKVPLVIWLTIHEVRPYFADANNVLRNMVAFHPNLAVADWSKVADQFPDCFSRDGLHLKGLGPNLMAFFVAGQVTSAQPGDGGHNAPATTTTTTTQAPAPATSAVALAGPTTTARPVARALQGSPAPALATVPRARPGRATWPLAVATIAVVVAITADVLRRRRRRYAHAVPRSRRRT
ncbi:MAG: hypothetical protein JWN46_1180 [Acidimicrobiales bacterium]|nr:hypothetical protein [Acidimicrobiales bacterium]